MRKNEFENFDILKYEQRVVNRENTEDRDK